MSLRSIKTIQERNSTFLIRFFLPKKIAQRCICRVRAKPDHSVISVASHGVQNLKPCRILCPCQTRGIFFLSINFLYSCFKLLSFLWSFFTSRLSNPFPFSDFSFKDLNGFSIKAVFNSPRIASNTSFVTPFFDDSF